MGDIRPEARFAQRKWECDYMLKFWGQRLNNATTPEDVKRIQWHVDYWNRQKESL